MSIRRALRPIYSAALIRGHGNMLSPSNYSSAAAASDQLDTATSLINNISSEIKLASKQIHDLDAAKPFGFPFKIEDNPGTKTVLLKRKFRNEHITVIVDLASGIPDDKEGDDDAHDQVSIPLTVTIEKGLSFWLEFGVTAFPEEIVVEYMVTKSSDIPDHGVPYEGRDFRDLKERMQRDVFEYLAIRGIEPNVTGFLIAYMMAKEGKEYLHWLKTLHHICH